jgi:hypothetical protein
VAVAGHCSHVTEVVSSFARPTRSWRTMAACDVCGNDYDKTFEIHRDGEVHVFDSFECAIHLMAPECDHCGVKVAGHGVESNGNVFCCAHCARREGVDQVADRV